MNVIFLSPHFPPHFYNFCDRLKRLGVHVLGIGDTPYEAIGDACQRALTDYYAVSSLENDDEVLRAAAYFTFKYGKIDYIDSQNEYWLELEARLRTDFDVRTGFKTEDMEDIKRKSRMKAGYARAGVRTARSHLVTDREGCYAFIREVGYPVVVKPDNGVGASNTYKLEDDAQFERFYSTKPENLFIMEEFVPGHIETFDGITDAEGNVLFCAGQVMVKTPMDMLHGTGENVSYTQNVQETDLYEIGCRVVRAFGTRNRFFHFEFFRLDEDKPGLGRRGEVLGLEVNMRAPGGYIPDKIDYAYDVDVYQIWAESLVFGENRSFRDAKFRYYVTHIGRSAQVSYLHSPQEIRDRYGEWIVLEKEPPRSISGTMGSHVFMLRAHSVEQLRAQAEFILMHADGRSWNEREGDGRDA